MTNIYNIPASEAFADTLARGILEKYGTDPLQLADIILLLPSRRSCRAVQEAFLRVTGGKPTLLPQMQPLGDVGDEEFIIKTSLGKLAADFPPVLSSSRQRLLLAKLIEKWQGGNIGGRITTAQATHLAIELASFLDDVQRHGLSWDRLHNIVPEELSRHWQVTLDFMDIIIRQWPEILAEYNVTDPGTYRNLALGALGKYWQESPPTAPVIAAGSTGSIPATAQLLKIISGLPQGAVILPGLDMVMDEESWDKLDETHPQYGLKNLLENFEKGRDKVQSWSGTTAAVTATESFISFAMLPSAVSYKWQQITSLIPYPLPLDITRINAPSLQEEAKSISLIMRDALETPGKTAALVTNDNSLVQSVIGIMERLGVVIDNSAGTKLANTPPCVLLRLVIKMVEEKLAPLPLLSCLKHPMVRVGFEAGKFKSIIRELEKSSLRGLRISGGIEGLKNKLGKNGKDDLLGFINLLEEKIKPFSHLMYQEKANFFELVEAHIQIAESLARAATTIGAEILWSSDEGECVREFLGEILESGKEFGEIHPSQYAGIFDALLEGKTYRPKYGSHPRLSILSPMEARMHSFDLVILGSLNEGSWPQIAEAGPWMSRPMRKLFGLPLPERTIGQSAHDFTQLLHNKEVILTRSEKNGGTATIPSRWLMRLDAVFEISGNKNALDPQKPWLEWAKLMDTPLSLAQPAAPKPSPPQYARPMEMSVSSVEQLMRDPYGYYANKILKLRKLDPIDMEPSPREFGQVIHKVMENFVTLYDSIPENGQKNFLHDTWERQLGAGNITQAVRAFWQPRFARIADELVEKEALRRANLALVAGEVNGAYEIMLADSRKFKVTARADRIEVDKNGHITIIDYKTKSSMGATAKNILNGSLPQMPLEALMAENAGFPGIKGNIKDMKYWLVTGGSDSDKAIEEETIAAKLEKAKCDMAGMLSITREGIENLAHKFTDVSTPYLATPDPDKASNYNDYEHLERVGEW